MIRNTARIPLRLALPAALRSKAARPASGVRPIGPQAEEAADKPQPSVSEKRVPPLSYGFAASLARPGTNFKELTKPWESAIAQNSNAQANPVSLQAHLKLHHPNFGEIAPCSPEHGTSIQPFHHFVMSSWLNNVKRLPISTTSTP